MEYTNASSGAEETTATVASPTERPDKRFHLKRCVFLSIFLPVGIASIAVPLWAYFKGLIELHHLAWITGGFAAAGATWLSSFLIYLHLTTYTHPDLQQKIIRIVIMVPVYAVDSFLSLVFSDYALYINLLRDCYESYVIYVFFSYLLLLLGGDEECVRTTTSAEFGHGLPVGHMSHPVPCCCLKPLRLDEKYLTSVRRWITQYMLVKPLCSIIAIILAYNGLYEEGNWDPHHGYLYIALIVNFSITFAFTALYYFFLGTREALAAHRPVGKFMCVKAVIFLSFWQSVAIAALTKFGFLACPDCTEWTAEDISQGVQAYLICVEMLFISALHPKVFPHTGFVDATTGVRSKLLPKNVAHSLSVKDVIQDVKRDVTRLTRLSSASRTMPTRTSHALFAKGAAVIAIVADDSKSGDWCIKCTGWSAMLRLKSEAEEPH